MATAVIMPRQGQSVESCIIGKWHKNKGDSVNEGDILFSYETDKASFEESAKTNGTMLEIFFQEGDDVPCLTNVCVIGNPGEDCSEFNPNNAASAPAEAAPAEPVEAAAAPAATSASAAATVNADGDLKISPRAKSLAERSGANLLLAEPTGPHGRIIERDVQKLIDDGKLATFTAKDSYTGNAIQGTGIGGRVTTADLANAKVTPVSAHGFTGVTEADYEDVKLSNIRKVIAKSMHNSLSTMAQLTLNASFDATQLLDYRKKLKAMGEGSGVEKITINDMLLFAVSRTILNHKELNAHYLDDKMRIFNNAHLGVATDTPRGLMVPTLFNANKLTLSEISKQAKSLSAMCRDGACSPDLLKDGTFTVTNLGSMGIESFTPVINPPQTAILGVCNSVTRVREADGKLVTYPAMGLSLTFDHRAVDGAPAAKFLKDLCTKLENFYTLLAF